MQKVTDRTRHRLLGGVMVIAVITLTAPTQAREVWEGTWLEARSPNFVVTSALRKPMTVKLVQELEDFRTLVGAVTNAGTLQERVPTRVYVFKGETPEVGLSGNLGGYFQQGLRANHAAVRIVNRIPLGQVLQHEYTHFLMRNQGRQAYPKWYDEGLAEVLGTVDLRNGRFTLGDISPGRTLTLAGPWKPYSDVIDDNQTIDRGRFYAQSWALVHYLTFGKPKLNFSEALQQYLVDREEGMAPIPAFEKAFHEDTATLGKTVRGYLQHAHLSRGELTNPFDPGKISIHELATDDIAARLADLCMATRQFKEAGTFADAALVANPDNAAALVVRADLLKMAGKYSEAEPLYSKAIALEPGSDLHHLDFAEYWQDRAILAGDDPASHDFYAKARHEFYLADKLNDHNPETLAYYGGSYLREGTDPAKGLPTLEYAHDLLPSNPDIKLMLAQMYVAVNQGTKARPLLRAVIAWGSDRQIEFAGKLLASIDGAGNSATQPPDRPADQPAPQRLRKMK